MRKAETTALMDKLGIKYPKKITLGQASDKIAEVLEEEGLPDDVDLTDEETEFLEGLGFELGEIEDEDVDDDDSGWPKPCEQKQWYEQSDTTETVGAKAPALGLTSEVTDG